MTMRKASVITLTALSMSVTYAQNSPDPFDPAVAVPKAWALLTSAIDAGGPRDRNAAVMALADAATPRARDVIDRIARDQSHPLRGVAISSLPSGDAAYLPVLADALQDPDLETRRSAIGQLGWIRDPGTLPLLQRVILRGDPDTIESAATSARLLGPPAFGLLLHAIETGGERSRESAIRCIEWLLLRWVSSESKATDNLEALRRLRPEPVLVRAVDDSNSLVRVYAALILARLGHSAGADELVRASRASDPKFGTIVSSHVAIAALHALGRPGYLPLLTAALQHAERRVRVDAALAMRSFPHPSMRDALNAAWRGTSDVRYQAFDGLVAIRGSADVGLLRAGLVDRDPYIRLRAAEALLAVTSDPDSVTTLEGLAVERGTRLRALSLLSTNGDPRRTAIVARSLLPKSAQDLSRMRSGHVYDPDHVLIAVHTLAVVQDREAVPALGALFGPDQTLNHRVARALVEIGRVDAASGRTLVRAMDSPHSTARIHAAAGVINLYTR
jgi:HEAT repeat protein